MKIEGTKFDLGAICMTPGASETLRQPPFPFTSLLARHGQGDWGEVNDEDKKLNDDALVDGGRLLSAYTVNGVKLWVITEAQDDDGNRSSTTFLLPEEY